MDDRPQACRLCGKAENLCDSLGMVRYNVPDSDPRWGKLFRCPNYPASADTDRQERLRRVSNLEVFADKTFDTFTPDVPGYEPREIDALTQAYQAALHFAERPQGWLLLEGGYGTGKTHLAAAIGNERLRRGDLVLFITSPDLLDYLRATYSPDAETGYDETFDRIRNASLLILDDLGVENPSQWAQEKLFQLLNHRYTHRLPTVITTNQELERLDARIKSRLLDIDRTRRVVINAGDYRSNDQRTRTPADDSLMLYQQYTFESFDAVNHLLPEERQNLQRVVRAARDYATDHRDQWLWLYGGYGTGKTHLAAAIALTRQQKRETVMFVNVPDWLERLRATFSGGRDAEISYSQRLAQVRNAPFLVLDDIGLKNPSPWARERLFQVLDHRYVTRRPTVLTSSGDLDELGERILTRVLDDRVCTRFELTCRAYTLRRRSVRG